MNPSVKAAWISNSVAVAVAVIGVIATGVAQWRGSKTAHTNALALFNRQADEQEKLRAVDALERQRTAFLADRRAVYAKFMRAMRHLQDETTKHEETTEKQAVTVAEPAGDPERNAEQPAALNSSLLETPAPFDRRMDAHDDVVLTLQEIFMLAPREVSDAAAAWYKARKDDDEPKTFALFLAAARLDVGVQVL
jgi:hypothetical protein